MKNQISIKDWETLSAYIDQQLSKNERSNFERRLNSDPRLQAAYNDLVKTRSLLHSLPRVRVPRNFTLKPQLVRARPALRVSYPVLSLASALATFLFVLVLVGDFFQTQRAMMVSPEATRQEQVQVFALEVQPEATKLSMAEEIETTLPPDQLLEQPPLAALGAEKAVEKTPVLEAMIESSAVIEEVTVQVEQLLPSQTPTLTPTPGLHTPSPTPPITETPSITATILPQQTEALEITPTTKPEPILTPLRFLEFSLLLVALTTGLAALVLRWQRRG